MRIKLENKTDYLDCDLLAFMHGALAAVGIKWRGIRVRGRNGKLCPLIVEVRYTRKYRSECHGWAVIGTSQRCRVKKWRRWLGALERVQP